MWLEALLLFLLIVAAVSACTMRHILGSVIIFISYGLLMSILWLFLQSPDLAITEAAVGAGISSILFFVALKRIRVMEEEHAEEHAREEAMRKNAAE